MPKYRKHAQWLEIGMLSYLVITVLKAVFPHLKLPARCYDMFAFEVGAERSRTMMFFHDGAGVTTAIVPVRLLPFEPARVTSIVRSAMAEGEPAIRGLGNAVLRAQRRGWRGFDQVWSPADISVTDASAVCVHVIPAAELDGISTMLHEDCRVGLG